MTHRTFRLHQFVVAAVIGVACAAAPRVVEAQTAEQLAAWYGLMLSPIGALAPIAHDPSLAGVPGSTLSLRYGRWRYDDDDEVHDNIGLTWAHRFAWLRTEIAVTGAYQPDECGSCGGWQIAGLTVRSTVVRLESARAIRFGVAATVDVGGAKYHGVGGATTFSLAGALPLEFTVSLPWTSSLSLAAIPGIGYGRITSDYRTNSGVLGSLGGAVAWAITSRATLDVGVQRVIMSRSVPQIGAAFSWQYHVTPAAK
jgi:hypothetical protein